MIPSELKIASISDIHLGNLRVPVEEIIDKLDTAFASGSDLKRLDIVFIAGDVFDRLLSLNERAAIECRIWVARFLRRCKTHDVIVRVLEGTPSHDWGQSDLFVSVNKIAKIECDVKYHNELTVEHIERFGIDVLYVPDEWEFDTDETWRQVTELLKKNNISKVDFAIMHGAFEYQFPAHLTLPVHKEENYLSIVRYYIFIGHVHRHLPKGRIIPNGSFDRLSHGEEENKGHVRAIIRKDGNHDVLFIPNEKAKRFDTVDCTGLTLDQATQRLNERCSDLPDDSYIRVVSNGDDPIIGAVNAFQEQWPNLNWSCKQNKSQIQRAQTLDDLRAKFKGVEISKDNLPALLLERLKQRSLDAHVENRCLQLLEETL